MTSSGKHLPEYQRKETCSVLWALCGSLCPKPLEKQCAVPPSKSCCAQATVARRSLCASRTAFLCRMTAGSGSLAATTRGRCCPVARTAAALCHAHLLFSAFFCTADHSMNLHLTVTLDTERQLPVACSPLRWLWTCAVEGARV